MHLWAHVTAAECICGRVDRCTYLELLQVAVKHLMGCMHLLLAVDSTTKHPQQRHRVMLALPTQAATAVACRSRNKSPDDALNPCTVLPWLVC